MAKKTFASRFGIGLIMILSGVVSLILFSTNKYNADTNTSRSALQSTSEYSIDDSSSGANATTPTNTSQKVDSQTTLERVRSAISGLGGSNKAVLASATAIVVGLLLIIYAIVQYIRIRKIDDNFSLR